MGELQDADELAGHIFHIQFCRPDLLFTLVTVHPGFLATGGCGGYRLLIA